MAKSSGMAVCSDTSTSAGRRSDSRLGAHASSAGNDYYRLLQDQIEVLRPFVYLVFYQDSGNGPQAVVHESMFLDHRGVAETNRFRYMKRFEHKLYAQGGEAVQIVFFDEGGRKMPRVLTSLLASVARVGTFNTGSQPSKHWIGFQYGWHCEGLDDSSMTSQSSNVLWVSQQRMLISTKCEVAFDEGGVTYTLFGFDVLSAMQLNVPIDQMTPKILLHEACARICKNHDNIPFCVSETYEKVFSESPEKDFQIEDPHMQARDALGFMSYWCQELSKNRKYTLYVHNQSAATAPQQELTGVTGIGTNKITRVELHANLSKTHEELKKAVHDGGAVNLMLPGWPQEGLVVNAFEKGSRTANGTMSGRGGVVLNFRPQVNFPALGSMTAEMVAAKPEERAVVHAASSPATGADPRVKTNDKRREGVIVSLAAPKLNDLQDTRQLVSAKTEFLDHQVRIWSDFHMAGVTCELECLGMPLYDDREVLATDSRLVLLDVKMPYYIGDQGDWESITYGIAGSNYRTDANQVLSGLYFVQHISHRIDESTGYSTAYSLAKLAPPGFNIAEVGGA